MKATDLPVTFVAGFSRNDAIASLGGTGHWPVGSGYQLGPDGLGGKLPPSTGW